MAGAQQYTVTAAALIASAPPSVNTTGPVGWFYIANGAAVVYLGGSAANATATTGASVAINGTFSGFLFPGDQIWAFCATTSVVTILLTGA